MGRLKHIVRWFTRRDHNEREMAAELEFHLERETEVFLRRGYPVYTFNQRSVAEILQMIRVVGALVVRADAGDALASRL